MLSDETCLPREVDKVSMIGCIFLPYIYFCLIITKESTTSLSFLLLHILFIFLNKIVDRTLLSLLINLYFLDPLKHYSKSSKKNKKLELQKKFTKPMTSCNNEMDFFPTNLMQHTPHEDNHQDHFHGFIIIFFICIFNFFIQIFNFFNFLKE